MTIDCQLFLYVAAHKAVAADKETLKDSDVVKGWAHVTEVGRECRTICNHGAAYASLEGHSDLVFPYGPGHLIISQLS